VLAAVVAPRLAGVHGGLALMAAAQAAALAESAARARDALQGSAAEFRAGRARGAAGARLRAALARLHAQAREHEVRPAHLPLQRQRECGQNEPFCLRAPPARRLLEN
jgi:hypothetical protein